MRRSIAAGACALSLFAGATVARSDSTPYDGAWNTILTCPNSNGALGFSFQFVSQVQDSKLHGDKGTKGEPGWLQIDGAIEADGSANLYVSGIVGAAPFAVGQRPAGTTYGYHVDAKFTARKGTGHRVEGRACAADFTKQ